jgi:protein-S-isoprenylcysteine O-methyltransferase Ste14
LLKVRAEERLLSDVFPDDYERYRRRVPALIPLMRRR